MKEYFYEENNKVYVIDDKEGLMVENNKNNNIDIFKTENNIELINRTINAENKEKYDLEVSKKTVKIQSMVLGGLSVGLLFILGGLAFQVKSIIDLIIVLLFSGCIALIPLVAVKEYFNLEKEISVKVKYINELTKELENENSKLNVLRLNSKDKCTNNGVYIKTQIPVAILLNSLKRKKEIITEFYNNEEKYINLYKSNRINELSVIYGYDNSEIELINCLVKEIIDENVNSKEKIKKQKM